MTTKEAIKILEVAQAECEWNAPLEYQGAFKLAITALGAIDQYIWERDIAVEQLKELGYELGEKIRTDDKNSSQELKNSSDCISRESLLAKSRPLAEPEDDFDDEYYSGYSCGASAVVRLIEQEPPAQPEPSEITDEQAILHLQSTGWMQNHDKEMYEMGLREQLAYDNGSYDSLIPSGDTILRQAAIELANSLKDNLPDDERIADIVMAHNEGILEYQTKLSLLPPAQPEEPTLEQIEEYCRKRCLSIVDNALLRKYAQPEPQWIPVNERLPEAEYPVIVTWMNNDPASYYQYILGKHYTGVAHYKNGKWYWYSSVTEDVLMEYGKCDSEEFDEAIEVIAWMSIPEPYQRGESNE